MKRKKINKHTQNTLTLCNEWRQEQQPNRFILCFFMDLSAISVVFCAIYVEKERFSLKNISKLFFIYMARHMQKKLNELRCFSFLFRSLFLSFSRFIFYKLFVECKMKKNGKEKII